MFGWFRTRRMTYYVARGERDRWRWFVDERGDPGEGIELIAQGPPHGFATADEARDACRRATGVRRECDPT